MQQTFYEDYKYSMQDVNRIYVGCKYTFEELLEAEDISFKFRMIMQRYVLPEANPEDTLETHLYYLLPESFLVKIYKQMKAKVRVNLLEEKRRLFAAGPGEDEGKPAQGKQYVTRMLSIEQLAAIMPSEKEKKGIVVQELSVSKLALTGM